MEENNKPIWTIDANHFPKPSLDKSPDVSQMTKVWSPRERAWFYFKPHLSEEFIMERLEKYRNKVVVR
jgi:hypothetical protein